MQFNVQRWLVLGVPPWIAFSRNCLYPSKLKIPWIPSHPISRSPYAACPSRHFSLSRQTLAQTSYDETINSVIDAFGDQIDQYLDANTFEGGRNGEKRSCEPSEYGSNFVLHFLEGGLSKTTKTRKKLSEWMDRDYLRVKTARCDVSRSVVPAQLYNQFVQYLYPVGSAFKYVRLYEAYHSLPQPRPLHIQPQHLETLLTMLMGSLSNDFRRRGLYYLSVFSDLVDSGLPISNKEYECAMYWMYQTNHEDNSMVIQNPKYLQQLNAKDFNTVAKFNMTLYFAMKRGKIDAFETQVKLLQENGIVPDRYTMTILMQYYSKRRDTRAVQALYRQMNESGYIMDISMFNVVLKSLLVCGEIQAAEEILDTIISKRSEDKTRSDSSFGRTGAETFEKFEANVQIRTLEVIRGILDAQGIQYNRSLFSVPLIPDDYTFGMFIGYYSLKAGQLNKALNIMQLKISLGNGVTRHDFYKLYKGFSVLHSSSSSEDLLIQSTQLLCNQPQSRESNYFTYLMAQAVLKSFRKVFPSSFQQISAYENDFEQMKLSRPRIESVYILLKRLSRINMKERVNDYR